MKKVNLVMFVFGLLCSITAYGQCPNLVWSDEFDGTSLNTADWNYQTGDGCDINLCGWGNNEEQFYKEENVEVSGGTLKITAKRERNRGSRYTSARINTNGKQGFTFGRMESRIKLPAGGGLWPAFWMLSTNEPYGGWPQSGEIDIMEFVGNQPEQVLGYIHYGDPSPNNQNQGNSFSLHEGNFFDEWHEFAVEWEADEIRWYMDGYLYSTKTSADVAPYNWPFDANNTMHFLLNVAVGGNLGGDVDDSIFPATMEVDYVRVYSGDRPSIAGDRIVDNQEAGVTYSVSNLGGGTNVNWSVPSGATIVSGQGSSSVVVDFGTTSGDVTASYDPGCGAETLAVDVKVEPPFIQEFTFENFDDPANATFSASDGTLRVVANPSPDATNSSANVAEYIRNSSATFDNFQYNTSSIPDASLYANGNKKFSIDVKTNAQIGTEVILQLETSLANSGNFPDGRHSRYKGVIEQNGSWQRIRFQYFDRPDAAAGDVSVSRIVILFNSNSNTGDTYYWDNLDSYTIDTGGGTNIPPTVSITSPDDGASFDEGTLITVDATASDSDGSVTQVEFFADGNSIGVDASAPYSMNWTVALGTTSLTAVATDNEGATTTSSAVSVTGNSTSSNTPPSVSITAPGNGSSFDEGTSISIDASASDSDGSVSQVEFFADGNSIGVDASAPYSVNWTVALGTTNLTAVATDNEGATTTSSVVGVTGNSTGSATLVRVASIVTGEANAGRGNKAGTAAITITDDLGNPISGANVTATFSGTFNETVSGITNGSGVANLQTSGTAKGGITVNVCVDDVTNTVLPYDSSANLATCTGSGARSFIPNVEEVTELNVRFFPNPFVDDFNLQLALPEAQEVNVSLIDVLGRTVLQQTVELQSGQREIELNVERLDPGMYFMNLVIGEVRHQYRLIKN